MQSTFGRNISGKSVLKENGRSVGELHNVHLNTETGELTSIRVEPGEESTASYPQDKHGNYIIDAKDVISIDDCIVISSTPT